MRMVKTFPVRFRRVSAAGFALLLCVPSTTLLSAPPKRRASRPAARLTGAAAPPVRTVAKEVTLLDRLMTVVRKPPILPRTEFAVAVARVGSSEPVLSYNGDRPLILASTTKVFTTAAALDRLGADYRFKTRFLREGEIDANGTLQGRLVVMGGGDPALSGRLYGNDPLAVFRPVAESLAARGIRRIAGGLLLDASFFDDQRTHPDWPDEQAQYWWQAPVSALSYNDNVVLVRATGSSRPGAPAFLGFHPAGPHALALSGRVTTISGRGANVGVRRQAGSSTIVAAGLVGRNRTWFGDVTVPNPPLYMGAALTQVLNEAGIEVLAPPSVTFQPARPEEAAKRVLLHTHETPISPVLAVANKRSQSFYSEQILKTLGAEKEGKGTWDNGRREVSAFLTSLGLDAARFELADGSGRSRNNRSSANAYLDFLNALATRWDDFPAFEPTLAISGDMAGTLRHRFLGEHVRGKVFGKTGNIAGVVTLTGYVTAVSGQKYAFVILINGGCPEGRGHVWQDRFVNELARFG